MIGVSSSDLIETISAVIEALAVPIEAAIVEVFEGVSAAAGAGTSLQSTYRPVVAGLQITTTTPCTLGYNARRKVSGQFDGSWYFLTNSHCTSSFGSPSGPSAGQATTSMIGTEVADPPLFTHTQDFDCPIGKQCRYSDASLYKYNSGVSLEFGAVAYPPLNSLNFTTTKWIAGAFVPWAGLAVRKIGKETGHRAGTVTQLCADLTVTATNRVLLCQGLASTNAINIGDSGSPVVWESSTTGHLYAVGLLHGLQTGAFGFTPYPQYYDEIEQSYGGALGFDISWKPSPTVSISVVATGQANHTGSSSLYVSVSASAPTPAGCSE